MKTTLIRKDLAKALNTASRFVSPKAQLPILGNVLLKAKKNSFVIIATNLEMSISIKLGAKIEKDGEITIPARALTDIISNLTEETVHLSSKEETLEIGASDFDASLSGMNSSEFPVVPEEVGKGVEINKELLVGGLSKTLFSVSLDETRPTLTGVLLKKEGDGQSLLSSDGFRLSQVKLSSPKGNIADSLIVPRNILSEVSRIDESIERIVLFHDTENNQIVFGAGNMVLSSRLIEGEFPSVENIIPKSTRVKAEVSKEDLLRAVKLASVITRGVGNVIKVEVEKDSVVVFAESAQSGKQKTKLDAKIDGEVGLTISFNYRFIEEFLNAIKGSVVELGFNDMASPGLFLDVDDKDYLHLIMPVRS